MASPGDDARGSRPTLPPIRDLFRDELSLPSRQGATPRAKDVTFSPSFGFSRLHLEDEDRRLPHLQTHPEFSSPFGAPESDTPGLTYGSSAASSHFLLSPTMPNSVTRRSSETVHRNPSPESIWRSRSFSDTTGMAKAADYHETYSHGVVAPAYPYDPRTNYPHQPSRLRSSSSAWSPDGSAFPPGPYMPAGFTSSPYIGALGSTISRRGSVNELANPAARFLCEYCGKGFTRPSSLKIHINHHTGEKPFQCPHEGCGRNFSVLSNMRRHARVHTQEGGSNHGHSRTASRSSDDASEGSNSAMASQEDLLATAH